MTPTNQEALRLLQQHGDGRLVTSNDVRGETWTFLRRRAGHTAAASFLDALERSGRIAVIRIEADLEAQAMS